MKIILFILVIGLGLTVPVHAQLRPGDGSAPLRADSVRTGSLKTDTTAFAILRDVADAYEAMEKNIELLYNKLIKESKDRMDDLKSQINEIQRQKENVQDQIRKLDAIMQKLEEEKNNAHSSLELQKNKALEQANKLITQKRWRQAQEYSQQIKSETQKARKDSLRLIDLRYKAQS